MPVGARYRVVEDVPGRPLVIRDVGPWDQFPSVTNDAENVIEELKRQGRLGRGAPWRRFLYLDSEGDLAEIILDDEGRFDGFGFVPPAEVFGLFRIGQEQGGSDGGGAG